MGPSGSAVCQPNGQTSAAPLIWRGTWLAPEQAATPPTPRKPTREILRGADQTHTKEGILMSEMRRQYDEELKKTQ